MGRGPALLKSVVALSVEGTTSFSMHSQMQITDIISHIAIAEIKGDFGNHLMGKLETHVPPIDIQVYGLVRAATNRRILEELWEDYDCALFHLFSLLRLQGRGQTGTLLTNGYPNIFYVKSMAKARPWDSEDNEKLIWVVKVSWSEKRNGWVIHTQPPGSPYEYSTGSYIIAKQNQIPATSQVLS